MPGLGGTVPSAVVRLCTCQVQQLPEGHMFWSPRRCLTGSKLGQHQRYGWRGHQICDNPAQAVCVARFPTELAGVQPEGAGGTPEGQHRGCHGMGEGVDAGRIGINSCDQELKCQWQHTHTHTCVVSDIRVPALSWAWLCTASGPRHKDGSNMTSRTSNMQTASLVAGGRVKTLSTARRSRRFDIFVERCALASADTMQAYVRMGILA